MCVVLLTKLRYAVKWMIQLLVILLGIISCIVSQVTCPFSLSESNLGLEGPWDCPLGGNSDVLIGFRVLNVTIKRGLEGSGPGLSFSSRAHKPTFQSWDVVNPCMCLSGFWLFLPDQKYRITCDSESAKDWAYPRDSVGCSGGVRLGAQVCFWWLRHHPGAVQEIVLCFLP